MTLLYKKRKLNLAAYYVHLDISKTFDSLKLPYLHSLQPIEYRGITYT